MSRSVLHPSNAATLARAAAGPLLVAFDFDGTLAPITPRPGDATMLTSTRCLLERLAGLYPTAVISGRSLADLAPRLPGSVLAGLVGNHGREWPGQESPECAAVAAWAEALRETLDGVAGVRIELKGASLSVHWRGAPAPGAARRRVAAAVTALRPAPRVIGGKALANLVPDDGIDKGTALRELMAATRSRNALYVGDDETDEDVFRLGVHAGVIGVRVGRARATFATYRLERRPQIDALLRTLIAWRSISLPSDPPTILDHDAFSNRP